MSFAKSDIQFDAEAGFPDLRPGAGDRRDDGGARPATSRDAVDGTGSRILDRLTDGIVFLWLFVLSEAVIPLVMLRGQEDFSDSQKLFLQALSKPFIVLSFLFLLLRFRGVLSILLRNKLLVAIVVWMWLSALWSVDPDVTLRRALLHSSFVIMACFIALTYDFRRIMGLFFLLTIMVLVTSAYFIVADPSLGFNPDGRGARGAFIHKNTLANFLVVGIAVALSAIRLRLAPRPVGYGVLAGSLALLVLANSTTALVAVAVMLAVFVLVSLRERMPFRPFSVLLLFSTALGIFAAMLLIANLDTFFQLLGRDATLTGRDDVWGYALRMISDRVYLGYGYSAFWESERIMSYVNETLNWHITHAHNGFLQIWLDLGLVGLVLMVAFLVVSVLRTMTGNHPAYLVAFALPFFMGMIVGDLVETHLFIYRHFGWIVMLLFIFMTTPGLDSLQKPRTVRR